MHTVKDILAVKKKIHKQVDADTLVIDALNLMNEINLSYLVVMAGGNYAGVFSERDYSRKIVLQGRHSNSTKVSEVMSTDIPEVDLSDSVEHCMHTMEKNRSRYLVTFNDDLSLAGVITIHDILRQVIHNKEDVFNVGLAGRLVDEDEGRIY